MNTNLTLLKGYIKKNRIEEFTSNYFPDIKIL
jgi:hypothetical protein